MRRKRGTISTGNESHHKILTTDSKVTTKYYTNSAAAMSKYC